jgi:hypothetical protein
MEIMEVYRVKKGIISLISFHLAMTLLLCSASSTGRVPPRFVRLELFASGSLILPCEGIAGKRRKGSTATQ